MPFTDRTDAGRRLADRLLFLRGEEIVVLGLPRGGVPVAFQVAEALRAPLDVIAVRKLGVPFQPELGIGALAEGGVRVINERVVRLAGVSDCEVAAVEQRERAEIASRAARLRRGRPAIPLAGRTAVVVDDGMATGSTARAACRAARARGAERVVLAVPVASPDALVDLGREVEVVCLYSPGDLCSVGQWYTDFSATSDEEVVGLLGRARPPAEFERPCAAELDPPVSIPVRTVPNDASAALPGDLTLPANPPGIVIFAHGSGSSRRSPRNCYVAASLNRSGLATLLFDLLTPDEMFDQRKVFDVELLGRRLAEATAWVRDQPHIGSLPIGYFGASTGAAAALWAASQPGTGVGAIVSRGGRPDLAGERVPLVQVPTLLVVGGRDTAVLALNRKAQARMNCENRLVVVPGAGHLFEEPGTLAVAAALAGHWFRDHLDGAGVHAA
jgi:putative phosphoribosyl transferase